MWLALANSSGIGDELAREIAAIARFADDLRARLSSAGVDGLGGALAARARIGAVLDAVSATELAEMGTRIAALVTGLTEIAERLERLRRVKTAVTR